MQPHWLKALVYLYYVVLHSLLKSAGYTLIDCSRSRQQHSVFLRARANCQSHGKQAKILSCIHRSYIVLASSTASSVRHRLCSLYALFRVHGLYCHHPVHLHLHLHLQRRRRRRRCRRWNSCHRDAAVMGERTSASHC